MVAYYLCQVANCQRYFGAYNFCKDGVGPSAPKVVVSLVVCELLWAAGVGGVVVVVPVFCARACTASGGPMCAGFLGRLQSERRVRKVIEYLSASICGMLCSHSKRAGPLRK
jgi:hypothetical protein